MAFLKDNKKNDTATSINSLITRADLGINALVQIKADLVSWASTLQSNTTDFTAADRTEFQAEMTRLTNRINVEL